MNTGDADVQIFGDLLLGVAGCEQLGMNARGSGASKGFAPL